MDTKISNKRRFQLVPVERFGIGYSATTNCVVENGEVRFDNVPPGRYYVQIDSGDDNVANLFSTEVEVRSGLVTEVAAQLP